MSGSDWVFYLGGSFCVLWAGAGLWSVYRNWFGW